MFKNLPKPKPINFTWRDVKDWSILTVVFIFAVWIIQSAWAGTHSLGVASGDSVQVFSSSTSCGVNQMLNATNGVVSCDDAPTGSVSATMVQATYITQTSNGGLDNEQALADLAGGILKSDGATGVISIATAGSDYIATESDPNVDTEAEIEGILGVAFGDAKTETAGYFPVADGDDLEIVAMSGDATLASGGAVTIANDAIEEAMLKAVDGASDEDFLSYESTTGDFEWHTASELAGKITEGSLTDDSIVEADLKAVDSPNDEECFTYEATTGDFEWQSCSAGGGSSNAPIFAKTIITPTASDSFYITAPASAITIAQINCITDPADTGETVTLDVNECDSNCDSCTSILTSAVVCANTMTSASISDANIASGNCLRVDVDAVSSTVTHDQVMIDCYE